MMLWFSKKFHNGLLLSIYSQIGSHNDGKWVCDKMRFYFRDFQCHIFCRGNSEKLYVTKDNRETQQNNCRSVCCIVVAVLFVSSAVAVATLIGGKEVLKNFFFAKKYTTPFFMISSGNHRSNAKKRSRLQGRPVPRYPFHDGQKPTHHSRNCIKRNLKL